MFEVHQTEEFAEWLTDLRDVRAKARIVARVTRFSLGNLGDVKPVGEGVSEARIDYGPGYRLYFIQRGRVMIVLLCGGTKKSQQADIEQAKVLAEIYG
ncbi:MAG: type II toxin-antitoxin system RelE/ParE family toxin [Asticcacaulis sp.]|nr:type II toxin-antitoxin system RelE/ParE family toxin [Asticcacaulis sp.]